MSRQNPGVESPTPPSPDDAIQPDAADFIEMPEVPPLAADREPLPIWLYLAGGFVLFLVGSSFTGLGVFGSGLLDQGAGLPVVSASSKQVSDVAASPMDVGKALYGGNCANCHQGTGAGEPGSYPPLVASDWVMGSKERLAAILLAGVTGTITVNGETFSTQVMPGWAGVFTDEKMAAIMTYIRASWGNTGDVVTTADVSAARAKFASHMAGPFTQADLMQMAPTDTAPAKK
jgi:mono/diheme cytochrome c family protein